MTAIKALKVLEPALNIGTGMAKFSAGDFLGGTNDFIRAGVGVVIKVVEQSHADAGKKADFDKIGIEQTVYIAQKSVESRRILREFWMALLKSATDPGRSIEIRRSDIELIESLNPSDCVLISAEKIKREIVKDRWNNTSEWARLQNVLSRYNETVSLEKKLHTTVPLRMILEELREQNNGAEIKISEEELLYSLNEKSGKINFQLFDNLTIVENICSQGVRAVGPRLEQDIKGKIHGIPDFTMVDYVLTSDSKRILHLIGG